MTTTKTHQVYQSVFSRRHTLLGTVVFLMACSSPPPERRLVKGLLEECPSSPNCIQTEYPKDQAHYFPPITIPRQFTIPLNTPATDTSESSKVSVAAVSMDKLRSKVRQTLQAMNGVLVKQGSEYTHATFTSSLFRFVDDFEVRIDSTGQLLHLRSASRVGYSDLGVNLERAQEFQTILTQNP